MYINNCNQNQNYNNIDLQSMYICTILRSIYILYTHKLFFFLALYRERWNELRTRTSFSPVPQMFKSFMNVLSMYVQYIHTSPLNILIFCIYCI